MTIRWLAEVSRPTIDCGPAFMLAPRGKVSDELILLKGTERFLCCEQLDAAVVALGACD